VTTRARLVLAVAAVAVPVSLAAACGPAATQDVRTTGANAEPGSQSWGTAATPTAAPTTAPGDPGPGSGEASLAGTVTMQRSGGFAGVMQSVAIAPDGAWTYTDRRAGTVRHGRLSQTQRERLAQALANPALTGEQAASTRVGVCSDGYLYQITWGRTKAQFVWCGSVGNRPAWVAVITLIEDATPM
jgi:hypothetical protein